MAFVPTSATSCAIFLEKASAFWNIPLPWTTSSVNSEPHFLIFFSQTEIPAVYATSNTTYFARIMQDDVKLYKSSIDVEDFSNIYFSLPRTYFVELLDELPNGFFKVNYLKNLLIFKLNLC